MKEIAPFKDGSSLGLTVQPRASKVELVLREDVLRVRLTSPAEGGKANKQLLSVLSSAIDIAPSRLELISGATARVKRVYVPGLAPGELEDRLLASLGKLF